MVPTSFSSNKLMVLYWEPLKGAFTAKELTAWTDGVAGSLPPTAINTQIKPNRYLLDTASFEVIPIVILYWWSMHIVLAAQQQDPADDPQ